MIQHWINVVLMSTINVESTISYSFWCCLSAFKSETQGPSGKKFQNDNMDVWYRKNGTLLMLRTQTKTWRSSSQLHWCSSVNTSHCFLMERRGNALRNTRRWKWAQCSGMEDVWRFSLVTPFPFHSSSSFSPLPLSTMLESCCHLLWLCSKAGVQWGLQNSLRCPLVTPDASELSGI